MGPITFIWTKFHDELTSRLSSQIIQYDIGNISYHFKTSIFVIYHVQYAQFLISRIWYLENMYYY